MFRFIFAGAQLQHAFEKLFSTVNPIFQSIDLRVNRIDQALSNLSAICGDRILPPVMPSPVTVMILASDPVHMATLASVARIAAEGVFFRGCHKRLDADCRIEMDIATEAPVVTLVFDGKRFAPPLK